MSKSMGSVQLICVWGGRWVFCQSTLYYNISKNPESQHLSLSPLASHCVSVFLPLCLCVCLPQSLRGVWGRVGNVLERERRLQREHGWVGGWWWRNAGIAPPAVWKGLSWLHPTADTRGEEGRTDGPNTRIGGKLSTKNSMVKSSEDR